jgi:hypothetical protein
VKVAAKNNIDVSRRIGSSLFIHGTSSLNSKTKKLRTILLAVRSSGTHNIAIKVLIALLSMVVRSVPFSRYMNDEIAGAINAKISVALAALLNVSAL